MDSSSSDYRVIVIDNAIINRVIKNYKLSMSKDWIWIETDQIIQISKRIQNHIKVTCFTAFN